MADSAMEKMMPGVAAGSNPERILSHRNIKRDNSRKKTKEIKRDERAWRSLGESNPCFSLERAAS